MAPRPGYVPAKPSGLTKGQIFALAEQVASQLNFGPASDIHEAVRRLGGRVSVETTLLDDPEHSGSLYVNALHNFEIIVPSHTSIVRDRFTIAHELGHYCLHYVLPRNRGELQAERVVALRKGSNRIEWEANWFAAAFLMPAAKFRNAMRRLNNNLSAVAREFDVSERAVEVRAEDIGV